jgi:hypothetical protein
MVDVVPGFYRQGGGYLIAANKVHNGDLVPLIRMIKGWNAKNSKYLNSFHLEVLALSILNNVMISDFPSGVRYYFDKARALVARQNPDPAGYSGDVGSYIDTQPKIHDAVAKFQLGYERALRAESLTTQGYVRQAIDTWSQVFEDYFPAWS